MKTVSVVIPNLHSPLIGQVIAALQAQSALDQIAEIIVVGMDRHRLVQPDARVRMLHTERPTPAGTARNLGAAAACGQYLLFLDADCLLAPDGLAWLLGASDRFDAIIGGVVLEHSQYWELCNNMLTFPYNTVVDGPGSRSSLASFCMLLPREVWSAVDGFDQRYTVACEDMDLSMRLRRAGYHLGCEPQAQVTHRSGRTTLPLCYQNHRVFGWYWRTIRQVHADMLPPAPTLRTVGEHGAIGAGLGVPLALLFVLRLVGLRRRLWRYWYALPGLFLLRLAFYDGYRQAAQNAAQP